MHDLNTIIKRNKEAAESEMGKLLEDPADYGYLYTARYWYYINLDFSVNMAAHLANCDVEDARNEYNESLLSKQIDAIFDDDTSEDDKACSDFETCDTCPAKSMQECNDLQMNSNPPAVR